MNAADTITSTERCGPRLYKFKKYTCNDFLNEFQLKETINFRFTFKYDLTLSQVFMLRTLFNRKCGNSDFLARLDEVKWEKSFAYKNLWENSSKLLSNIKLHFY